MAGTGGYGDDVRAHPIRFPDELWDAIEAEAKRTGSSAAQVVRDATAARVIPNAERRELLRRLDDLSRRVDDLARERA